MQIWAVDLLPDFVIVAIVIALIYFNKSVSFRKINGTDSNDVSIVSNIHVYTVRVVAVPTGRYGFSELVPSLVDLVVAIHVHLAEMESAGDDCGSITGEG
mmetsp:Transcript_36971/g.52232  ORF Transcript_36971/g.52232 Transcript_36971/m.52232 type:complete len:100 (+) Transcript_36971:639-938(+)